MDAVILLTGGNLIKIACNIKKDFTTYISRVQLNKDHVSILSVFVETFGTFPEQLEPATLLKKIDEAFLSRNNQFPPPQQLQKWLILHYINITTYLSHWDIFWKFPHQLILYLTVPWTSSRSSHLSKNNLCQLQEQLFLKSSLKFMKGKNNFQGLLW